MEELVTAIITTHNRLALLKKAIESVKRQTYENIEVIVVDDHSDDGTKEYCQNLSDVKYIFIPLEESKGGNYARNQGIRHSSGNFIAFLDDDDEWVPTKIEKQIKLITEKGNDYVYCGLEQIIITKGSIVHKVKPCNQNYSGNVSKKILSKIFTTTSCLLLSRKVFDEIGYFDENLKFWQEYELSLRAAQITDFYYVDEPLVLYTINRSDKQRLTNKVFKWHATTKYIYKKHKNLYRTLSITDKLAYRKLILKEFVARFYNSIVGAIF